MKSMTGFGRGIAHAQGMSLETTIRTLNHRYCQTKIKLSPELYEFESEVRDYLLQRISRGTVELMMKLEYPLSDISRLKVDYVLAREYIYSLQKMRTKIDLPGITIEPSIRLDALLNLDAIWCVQPPEIPPEEMRKLMWESLEIALDAVIEMRSIEGEKLTMVIKTILANIETIVPAIEALAQTQYDIVFERCRSRFEEKFSAAAIDDQRIQEEVHFFCERGDITEELDRLKSHLVATIKEIDEPGPSGRKMEFLIQEMYREANTLGVKAASAEISTHVISLKTDLDKLKEQILNIE